MNLTHQLPRITLLSKKKPHPFSYEQLFCGCVLIIYLFSFVYSLTPLNPSLTIPRLFVPEARGSQCLGGWEGPVRNRAVFKPYQQDTNLGRGLHQQSLP